MNCNPVTVQPQERPFQFTVRQLLLAMLAVSFACARVFQWGPGGVLVCLMVGSMATMCYGAYWGNYWFAVGLSGFLLGGCVMLVPHTSTPAWARRQFSCQCNLKQIGISLHNYHDEYGCFPPAYIRDASGRPMHSWRVLLLPYLEHKPLYDRYNFNEPWDGPNNSKLAAEMPKVYRCPGESQPPGRTNTSYVAVVGDGTIWRGEKSVSLTAVTDGKSNTIFVVESHGSGINWMEPRDLHALQMPPGINPKRGQGICSCHGPRDKGPCCASVGFADGSVQSLENDVPAKTIDAMLTIAGGETVTWP